MRQTTLAKPGEVKQQWRQVSADGQVLGRLAAKVARVLQGKHRPTYTPHIDTGDFVIITDAEKIVLTGNKASQSLHYRYSQYPGGINVRTAGQIRDTNPEELIMLAVRRMLPKGILGRQMLTKLRVFKGPSHPHAAQQPIGLDD